MADGPDVMLDHDDPGDDTQLRFRYQHGYGVILLAGAATGKLPYVAVWCEHHEDLLGEKANGQYDSFQIKTATPEGGPWKLGREKLRHSFQRFVEQDKKFPGRFDAHSFVSNVSYYDTEQASEIEKSPVKLLAAVRSCTNVGDLASPYSTALNDLSQKIGCNVADLFGTCKRVKLVAGPPKESFETEVAHLHLPKLDGCSMLTAVELDGLRDEMIQVVFNASSLAINDPSKHWCCVLGDDHLNPRLRAKRLVVSDVVTDVLSGKSVIFRFAPSTSELKLREQQHDLGILAKKMVKGGLATQLDMMQWRTLSAERHLLSLAAQDPDEAAKVLNQLKGIVKGACVDAQTLASARPEPWGVEMYRQVTTRLQRVADHQPDLACQQAYECLIGVAGLLTEECEVWWSPSFDTKEAI